jgi:uncharacterized protein (TIRG00374 family)
LVDGADHLRTDSRASRDWRWRLLGLAISVVAIAIVVVTVDIGAAIETLIGADLMVLALVLVVITAQLLVRAWRWRILLPERPDGSVVPIARAVPPLLIGYLGNAVLPARLGEPIRALLVARREALDALAAFGATMLERLVDTTTLALVALVAALALGAAGWVIGVGAAVGFGGLVLLGLLVAVGAARLSELAVRILHRLGVGQRTQRLQRWSRSFAAGLDRGRDIRRLASAIALSLVAWVLDGLTFLVVARSLQLDIGLAQAVLIGAVTVLATAVPAAPGYVGTFELATTTTAVALGVPEADALALAILVHVVTVIPLAAAGAVALVLVGVRLSSLMVDAEEEVDHASA